MVRYYAYSNRSMGQQRKEGMLRPGDKPPGKEDSVDFTILDVSYYDPPHVPSKTWRELIKKVWEVDPLTCLRCGSDLPAIASSGEAGGDADYQPDPGPRRNSSDTEAPGSLEAGC